MVNLKIMNKDQIIIQTAKRLIQENGQTTTLEVKNELRRLFTEEDWYQSEVSQTLIDWEAFEVGYMFSDNGDYRTYFFVDSVTPSISETYTFPNGIKITGSIEQIIEMGDKLGYPLHYSSSKRKFFLLEELQINHLSNILTNEIENMSNKYDTKTFVEKLATNKYSKELLSREI